MAQLFQDEMAALGIADTGGATTTPGSGIGMSPAQPVASRNPRQEAIDKMGGFEKLMASIGEGSAAFLGRPSPLGLKIEEQRKQKQTELDELRNYTSSLEEGVKLAEGVEGPDRDRFVKSYRDRLERLSPGLGDTFETASKRPELLTKFREILPLMPKPMQDMAAANPRGFLKFVGTATGAEMMAKADDQRLLGSASKKVQTTLMGLQQLVSPEKLAAFNKDGVITAKEIREMQADLPEPLRMGEDELGAITRNDEMFWTGLGVLSGKGEQEVMKKRAEKAGDAPKTRTVRRGTKEITQDFKDGKWVDVEKGEAFKPSEHKLPDDVKERVAAIQLKILGGQDPDAKERQFLDEVARTNPLVAAMRDALGGAQAPSGGGAAAPGNKASGKITKKREVGDTIDRAGKKYKVVGHDKDGEPLVELVK